MKSLLQKLKNKIKDKYIMPTSLKKEIVNKNLHRMKILLPILFCYGLFFLFITVFFRPSSINQLYHVLYYSITIFISVVAFVLLLFFQNSQLKLRVKLIPMYFVLGWLLILCLIALYMENGSLNAILSLFCLIVVTLAILYVEPILFLISGLVIVAPTIVNFIIIGDKLSAINFVILYIIFDGISLFRWGSIISELKHEKIITQQNEKLSKEIELAGVLQQNFYKHQNFNLKDWIVGYHYSPMMGVSGDLFDFYTTKNDLDGLGIFDISGHGISSGLLTMLVKNILHSEFYKEKYKTLDEVVYHVNDRIIEEKGNVENYITGILIQTIKNKLNLVIAGHPAPIVFNSKTNKTSYFDVDYEEKPSIIGMKGIPIYYKVENIELNSDDEIVLYTDGITDLQNEDGKTFGKKRLLEVIAANVKEPVEQQIAALKEEIDNFKGSLSQTDDITIVILKRK